MPTLTLKKIEPHPIGQFTARIIDAEEDESSFGPTIRLRLRTEQGDLSVIASATYSAKSKLGGIVRSALGSMPADLDTDQLIGKEIRVTVEHKETPEGTFDQVTAFAPVTSDPFEDA